MNASMLRHAALGALALSSALCASCASVSFDDTESSIVGADAYTALPEVSFLPPLATLHV